MSNERESGRENLPVLEFEAGWQDILSSPDATDYQRQFDQLVALTQQRVLEEWVQNTEAVKHRWKLFIERIAYLAITEDDLREMTPSQIVETAFITLTTNLESIGWQEEGKSVLIPDLARDEESEGELLDITNL